MALLQNEGQALILEAIDEMRDLGVNEDISIPQIVVVGDQSSGKSSTLQAITHTPLAVDSELYEETKQHLLRFTREFPEEEFNEDGVFTEVVNDAAEHMGLPTPGAVSKKAFDKRFWGDVLKIELFGPKQPHLSVVDVPGLFHNDTIYQTKEDLEIVRRLMKDYMDNPRSIILAVMDARVNLSNQEVFRFAREADKDGSRTVGVITKCDALQRGDEKEVLNIAQNTDGVTLQERDVREKAFFDAVSPWNILSKERVSVEPLTRFLSNLLLSHIQKEFPVLLNEIEALVARTQEQLKGYGDPRQTLSQWRRFLRRMAAQYQKFVENGLNGVSLAEPGSGNPTKLRWLIRTSNEAFARNFEENGHQWAFKTAENSVDPEFARWNTDERSEYEATYDIYDRIRKVHNESKVVELQGTVHPQLITVVFRQQTKPWEELSEAHLTDAKRIVDQYLKVTFQKVVKDPYVIQNLERFLRPRVLEGHSKADEELRKLLEDERGGTLQTVNHYLAETLAKIRRDRVVQRLKDAGYEEGYDYERDLENMAMAKNISNDDIAVYDIHDIVKSYYKVAMKRFLDNVFIQVVERHILGPKSPLRLFSSDFVDDLEDDQVKFIASESSSTSMARLDLTTKLERLQKALDIAHGVSLSY